MGTKTETIEIERTADSDITLEQLIKEFEEIVTELKTAKDYGYHEAGSVYKIKLCVRKDIGQRPKSFNTGGGKD